MIDSKSKLVLKILASECRDGSYKIIESSDIITALPRHLRVDNDAIRHILTYLERQDIISIKYDDDNTYCLSVLPYGFEILENQSQKLITTKTLPNSPSGATIFFTFLSSFVGTLFAIFICYFIIKLL